MELFVPVLEQMLELFAFIVVGFILSRWKFIPENSSTVLSKIANCILVPALVMRTFIKECTLDKIAQLWPILVMGFALVAVLIPLSLLVAKLCLKEDFQRKVAAYGLAFSNFGFMGYVVVAQQFPEINLAYTVFTLPFWFMIYAWAVPTLLIPSEHNEKPTMFSRVKRFINPMMIGLLIGLVLGLTGLGAILPTPVMNVIDTAGNCMSPVSMLLTGITIGKIDLLALIKKWRLYIVTAMKLIVYPLFFLGIVWLLSLAPENMFLNSTFFKCVMCMTAMPMGLTSIVVPAAYGKDTSDAAGLALFTHVFSIVTIPLMFMLFQTVIV